MPQILDPTAFYTLLLKGLIGGQQVLNRFRYARSGDPNIMDAIDLATSFLTQLVPPLLDILSQEYRVTSVYAENFSESEDFGEIAGGPNDIGARPGNHVGPWAAWGYKIASGDRAIRAGGKRFAGVSEDDVDQGVLDDNSPIAADVPVFAANIDVPLTSITDPSGTWLPVLTTPGNTATGGLPWWAAMDVVTYERFTTQNTRKPWG